MPGQAGRFEAYGVYFADAGQHLEHRLFVDHEPAHCRSHVEYKGALQGDTAHTVWIGDVLIRASAEGTDTYEVNRNLILTDGARADSVPNLEIETGEIVGAGHASATGRFDDEQLFYLQARGIPEDEARRLVVRGFFADIINRIPVAELQGHLMHAVERELSGVEAASRTAWRRPRDRREHDGIHEGVRARGPHPGHPGRGGRRRGHRRARAHGHRPGRHRVCRERHLHPRQRVAVGGRGGRLHDRVLAARVALRPAHRRAHRPPGDRPRRHLPSQDRRW